jgi:hypothetical protein
MNTALRAGTDNRKKQAAVEETERDEKEKEENKAESPTVMKVSRVASQSPHAALAEVLSPEGRYSKPKERSGRGRDQGRRQARTGRAPRDKRDGGLVCPRRPEVTLPMQR